MNANVERGFAADPLKHIPAALLNSADIQAYQAACQLIRDEPFDHSPARLKAASYQILCRGDVFWSDPASDGRRQKERIGGGKSFTLRRNSIAFISPDVQFCLPDYIAARFNLTISLVHKGLLLGTGPLIDPGFEGRLLIPLHNLTTFDVELKETDGLIWVEFTKLSPDQTQKVDDKVYVFRPSFEPDQKNRSVEHYFGKTGGVPPQSSLADNARKWKEALDGANAARERAEALSKRLQRISIGAIAATAIAIVALVVTTVSLVRDANQWVSDASKNAMQEMKSELGALKQQVETVDKELRRRPSEATKPVVATKDAKK
jgi:deoxycytidine triphosphate deaminase